MTLWIQELQRDEGLIEENADPDGEILWRAGESFSPGSTELSVEEIMAVFYNRRTVVHFNVAAEAGWDFEQMIELRHDEFEGQTGPARLHTLSWRLGAI